MVYCPLTFSVNLIVLARSNHYSPVPGQVRAAWVVHPGLPFLELSWKMTELCIKLARKERRGLKSWQTVAHGGHPATPGSHSGAFLNMAGPHRKHLQQAKACRFEVYCK